MDRLFDELWQSGPTTDCIPVLLSVFDRYPDEDGAGVFWSIVHGLEQSFDPEYEVFLRTSAQQNPTEFKRIMLMRIDNAK